MNKSIYTYSQGAYVPFGLRFAALGAILFAFAFLSQGYLWGPIITIIISIAMIVNACGMQVDPTEGRFRVYQKVLGIQFGRWEKLSNYPDILVLRSNKRQQHGLNGISGYQSAVYTDHEVYLANPNHFQLIMVKKLKTSEAAWEIAHELSQLTGQEIVQYNPGRKRPRVILANQPT
ncbi:MAG: hypothetical protein AAF206_01165 [Bacteroidota bacterium]